MNRKRLFVKALCVISFECAVNEGVQVVSRTVLMIRLQPV